MTCWQVLELAPDSDARSIKRRYAERLKVCRPDRDPVAFQRLREAYEQALASARRGTPEPVVSVVVSEMAKQIVVPAAPVVPAEPAFEAADVPLVQPVNDDRHWLHEVVENLDAAHLDTYLAQARARNCHVLFEQRLLEQCLSDREDTALLIDWALAHLQWLTPWQASPLPTARLEQLAARLLQWHLAELAAFLERGEEAHAHAAVLRFYRQPWMHAVDRSAAYSQTVVDWMMANEDAGRVFFARVCSVFGWDPQSGSLPIAHWKQQELSKRTERHRFSKRTRLLLAQSEPRSIDESAAWMLFKDLDVRERRRLADTFIEHDWAACEHMQRIAESEPPESMGDLQLADNFDWQRYRLGQGWAGAHYWLVAFCVLAFVWMRVANPAHEDLVGTARSIIGFLVESALSGVFAALLLRGVHGGWNWLARQFTGTDIALAQRLLPASLHCDGAGLLPLRNGVPCIALGALLGALLASRTGLSALQIIPLALLGMVLPLAYVLLQFYLPTLPKLVRWWRASIERLMAYTVVVGGLTGLGLLLWFSKLH